MTNKLSIQCADRSRQAFCGCRLLVSLACLLVLLTWSVATLSDASPVLSLAQFDRARQLDLLILHGTLVDGSGKKTRIADVGISGDRIVFVGNAVKAHVTASRSQAAGLTSPVGLDGELTHSSPGRVAGGRSPGRARTGTLAAPAILAPMS